MRMECAVRTKPKPRKGAFEGGGSGNRLSAGVLEKFLRRQSNGGASGDGADDNVRTKTVPVVKSEPAKQRRVTWGDDVVGHGDGDGDSDVEAGASSSADEDDGLLDDVDGVDDDDASSVVIA